MKLINITLISILLSSTAHADWTTRQVQRSNNIVNSQVEFTDCIPPWSLMDSDEFKIRGTEKFLLVNGVDWFHRQEIFESYAKKQGFWLSLCSYCERFKSIIHVSKKDMERPRLISHGICPVCAEEQDKEAGYYESAKNDQGYVDRINKQRQKEASINWYFSHQPLKPFTLMHDKEFRLRVLQREIRLTCNDWIDLLIKYDNYGKQNSVIVTLCEDCYNVTNAIKTNHGVFSIQRVHVATNLCYDCLIARHKGMDSDEFRAIIHPNLIDQKNKEVVMERYFERNP